MNFTPHIEAEKSFLTALLADWQRGGDLLSMVNTSHFFSQAHQSFVESLRECENDIAILLLKADKDFVLSLMDGSVMAHPEILHRIVKDNYIERELHSQISRCEKLGYDRLTFAQSDNTRIESEISEGGTDSAAENFCTSLVDTRAHVRTGIPTLDKALGEIELGEKIVIAARPNGGKTSLAVCLAYNINIFNGVKVGFRSMESPDKQIMRRILACKEGISIGAMKRYREHEKTLSDAQVEMLMNSAHEVTKNGIGIYSCSGMSSEQISMQMRISDNVVEVVDHMQKFRGRDLRQAIGDASNQFATVADQKEKIVILLSQLNRDAERENREPRMSDLKESGDLEQDADTIIFIHTEPDTKEMNVVDAKLIVAKRRDGETGFCHVTWNKSISRFYNETEVKPLF